jgi:hypothetical protein
MTTVQQAREEVQSLVKQALMIATNPGPTAAGQVEAQLWQILLGVGCALMELYFATQTARLGKRSYEHAAVRYKVCGWDSVEIGTRFGKVAFQRPVGCVMGSDRAARDFPLDREIGLAGSFTLSVVTDLARLCAHMAFAPARALYRATFGWAPSPRALLRMVDAVGAQAKPFVDQSPPPDDDGEVLVVTVDGKGAPAISSKEYHRRARPHAPKQDNQRHGRRQQRREQPKTRRGPGKKSKNAKMAAVGVLYTLRADAEGNLDGPVNKRVYATFQSYRALFEWIHQEAVKRGYGTSKFSKVLFVADGADVLWRLQQEFFPDALPCLDWFHVVEKLWAVGKAVCRNTRRQRGQLEAWVAEHKSMLRKGQVRELLCALEQALQDTAATGPGNKFRRKVLASVLAHLRKHEDRMRYAWLRSQDLEIGSGVVEGAVRHVVGMRLDGPGMRWGRDRAEAVVRIRCILVNGMWEQFESYLRSLPVLRLAGQPVPTRTHDAVVKKAA